MFDFIPLQYYTPIYYYLLLVCFFLFRFKTEFSELESVSNKLSMKIFGLFLTFSLILYMGLRPNDHYFGDMPLYTYSFNKAANSSSAIINKDYLFNYFTFYCAKFMNVETYFFICTVIYILPLYFACKKWFSNGAVYALLLIFGSLSFWAYGTNGIRNGMASSVFIFALSRDKLFFKLIFALIAIGLHKTIMIPTIGLVLFIFIKKPKYFLYAWSFSIPLSLIFGAKLQLLFAEMIEDDRSSYLTKQASESNFSNVGFRWDFLIYSVIPVFAGWYFIFQKKFEDKIYNMMYVIYLCSNAIWIIVIRANFSNRFAYLSWFMMGLIIIYPLLKEYLLPKQHKVIGYIMLIYFSFTFIMNILLK